MVLGFPQKFQGEVNMYQIIRYAFFIVLLVVVFFILRKKQIKIKKWVVWCGLIIWLLCTFLSVLVPIENLFITFDSPQAVLNYTGGVRELFFTVEGEESMLLVYMSKENAQSSEVIKKTNDGWQINPFTSRHSNVISKEEATYICSMYQYRNTDDYYVTVHIQGKLSNNMAKEAIEISDNKNTVFKYYEEGESNSDFDILDITYYAYIKGFDENYVLTVNGNTVTFD